MPSHPAATCRAADTTVSRSRLGRVGMPGQRLTTHFVCAAEHTTALASAHAPWPTAGCKGLAETTGPQDEDARRALAPPLGAQRSGLGSAARACTHAMPRAQLRGRGWGARPRVTPHPSPVLRLCSLWLPSAVVAQERGMRAEAACHGAARAISRARSDSRHSPAPSTPSRRRPTARSSTGSSAAQTCRGGCAGRCRIPTCPGRSA